MVQLRAVVCNEEQNRVVPNALRLERRGDVAHAVVKLGYHGSLQLGDVCGCGAVEVDCITRSLQAVRFARVSRRLLRFAAAPVNNHT